MKIAGLKIKYVQHGLNTELYHHYLNLHKFIHQRVKTVLKTKEKVAILDFQGQGQGLEAKDLSAEAKAKDLMAEAKTTAFCPSVLHDSFVRTEKYAFRMS